jgi:hypothetical protein
MLGKSSRSRGKIGRPAQARPHKRDEENVVAVPRLRCYLPLAQHYSIEVLGTAGTDIYRRITAMAILEIVSALIAQITHDATGRILLKAKMTTIPSFVPTFPLLMEPPPIPKNPTNRRMVTSDVSAPASIGMKIENDAEDDRRDRHVITIPEATTGV